MDVRIYDVEHGDCFLIVSSQNEAVLVDCGYNRTTGWRPSEGLALQGFGTRRRLQHLLITHPDQDHLADLPEVMAKLRPEHVWQHPQLRLATLADLKLTLSKAQTAYLERSKTIGELQPIEATRQFRTMELRLFYLPLGSVRDVNDLSMVAFFTEGGFTVCLPGDLNARGWRLHLKNDAFKYMLRETNLLVASHHGRPSGYCKEVFEYLSPRLIVISDKEQSTGMTVVQRAPYRDHAKGVPMPDGSFRKVLTTRGDGRLRIVVNGGKWEVTTTKLPAGKS